MVTSQDIARTPLRRPSIKAYQFTNSRNEQLPITGPPDRHIEYANFLLELSRKKLGALIRREVKNAVF